MDRDVGTPGALGIFSALNLLAFALVFFLVEETRRLDLEELDKIFGQPKLRHIKYQARETLGRAVKRITFRDPGVGQTYDEHVTQVTSDVHV
jgi:hypothetical protein